MKLADIKPVAAKFYLKHPVSREVIKDDNDKEVFWNVVGHDSQEYYQSKQDFVKYLEQLGDKSKDLTSEEYRQQAVKQISSMVIGWDEQFNDFMGGKFSRKKVEELLASPEHNWIMAQLDTFLADRSNFFGK